MGVTFGVSAAATNAHHPHRIRDRWRSDRQRRRREPIALKLLQHSALLPKPPKSPPPRPPKPPPPPPAP